MAKNDILNILKSRKVDPLDFQFDMMQIPPLYYFIPPQDVMELNKIVTSLKMASKLDQKLKLIDNIMVRNGFRKLGAGTNRVVYRYLEDTTFVAKIAIDRVGLQDNPLEFRNQHLLKPFVTKMFCISPCGTIGLAERVEPVIRATEFEIIQDDVYEVLVNNLIGKFVLEDVGTKYFMNWGIRAGFGPVLLDYPYAYEIDSKKLYCNHQDIDTGVYCDGVIDYDVGFNNLVCNKCGKRYLARELSSYQEENKIIIGGIKPMKVSVMCGDNVIIKPMQVSDTIQPKKRKVKKEDLKFTVSYNNPESGELVVCNVNEGSKKKASTNSQQNQYRGGKKNYNATSKVSVSDHDPDDRFEPDSQYPEPKRTHVNTDEDTDKGPINEDVSAPETPSNDLDSIIKKRKQERESENSTNTSSDKAEESTTVKGKKISSAKKKPMTESNFIVKDEEEKKSSIEEY